MRSFLQRWGLWLLALVLAAGFQLWIIRTVYRVNHEPAAPLDDAYIHLQYARSIADGHPFAFGGPGETPSSGATSILYPALLAPFYALGLREAKLFWAAWVVCAIAWAVTAVAAFRVGQASVGNTLGVGGFALTFACSGYFFVAGSCMETGLAMALVVGGWATLLQYSEERDERSMKLLSVLGFIAPFVRPELAAFSLLALVSIVLGSKRLHRWAALPLLGLPAVSLFWKLLTGTSRTTGAQMKWILFDPYLTRMEQLNQIGGALQNSWTEVLAGKNWAERYFPLYWQWLIPVGLLCVFGRAIYRRRWLSLLAWVGAVLLPLIPCTFHGWNVHRYRYLWPVFALPMIASFALPALLGTAVGGVLQRRFGQRFPWIGSVSEGTLALVPMLVLLALFAKRIPAVVEDVADSANAIERQQIALARGPIARLGPRERILINDAGAITYFGGHVTVDFVGLTTMELAAAWPHGGGSTFEGIESLPPGRRPTYGALYRHWMTAEALLGPTIESVLTRNQSILGGDLAEFMALRTELYDSGATTSIRTPTERVVDEIDVALVTNERAHSYDNLGDVRADNLLRVYEQNGRPIADGGRVVRRGEDFVLQGIAGRAARLVLRTDAFFPTQLAIEWNGTPLPSVPRLTVTRSFVDVPFAVPASMMQERNQVRVRIHEGDYGSFHWFLLQ